MKKTLMALAAILLTACSSKDVFDPNYEENVTKQTYSENFTRKYSDVDLNQSWDYSHKNAAYSLDQTSSKARTRANDYTAVEGEDYVIDNDMLKWMKSKLTEQKNHRSLGSPFYMTVPNNSFTIVPIYQGKASMVWELHMVVDGIDIKVWEKCQNIWVKKNVNDENWTSVGDLSSTELEKNTISAATVKATPYTFQNLPVGANMYFYLLVTDAGNDHKNLQGAQQSSLNGMMLALTECPRPANIDEDNEVMIVGCEDLSDNGSDWDLNDLVFMVYGKPNVPQPIKIEEGNPVTKKTTVRYMIEDLGATDDFDFNDIVVDVSDIYTSTPTYKNGVLDSWTDTDHRQEATIRHLGGTLPFKLKIGDTQLEERQGVMNSDPDETFTVTGWDINTHNISVEVRQATNQQVYNHVTFPKAGEAPVIIAVDPTVQWMPERQSVPAEWFYIPE